MRDGLEEGDTVDFLFVPVPGEEVLCFDERYLHDVADVQVLRPLRLI